MLPRALLLLKKGRTDIGKQLALFAMALSKYVLTCIESARKIRNCVWGHEEFAVRMKRPS